MSLVGNWVGRPLRKAAELVLTREDREAQNVLHRRLAGLFCRVLAGDGVPGDRDFEAVRFALREHPAQEITALTGAMRHAAPVTVPELKETFSGMTPAERDELLRVALSLGIGAGRQQENHDFLLEFATGIGMDREAFLELETKLAESEERRRKLLRSGAGIIVALIVIGVFILTATLLRSVIFGLIGAYVMLPLEKFFERKLSKPCSWISLTYKGIAVLGAPFRKLAEKLRRGNRERSAAEKAARERQLLISRSVFMTVLTLLLVLGFAVGGISTFSGRFVRKLHTRVVTQTQKIRNNAILPVTEYLQGKALVRKANVYLAELRRRFDSNPLLQASIAHVSKMLNDPALQQELLKQVLKRTGGVFAFTAGVLGEVCSILADLLLTVFFFLLFLTKLAEIRDSRNGAWQGEYLVRTVFSSAWLPGADEGTLLEAQRIISEVLTRLKIWLKGYLTLMLVDATVYTTVFYCLNVPYFFILGPLAGCGILLPYIGPIISCVLTLAVTLAAGGSAVSTGMLISILAAYLVYNGIIEQFILYPAVIGESLGLTTLETIIVVLLGAIFAGIAGMLLAIPAASVLKYLVPQIYHCFDQRKKNADNA